MAESPIRQTTTATEVGLGEGRSAISTPSPMAGIELSFEFFPPRTARMEAQLKSAYVQLASLRPRFFSVTYGAGGTTRVKTAETVAKIRQETGVETAPHLACIGSTYEEVGAILNRYLEMGIRRIVALRGDLPSGMLNGGEFRYASDLVRFIRKRTGDHFHISVAAYPEVHPQARDWKSDLLHFKEKVGAGADSAITQYFYNPDAYFAFVEACRKLEISIPIVPGIMPITNYDQLARFSDRCGAEIPRWLRKRLEFYAEDAESLYELGLDVVTALLERLLEGGVRAFHFYTLNRAEPTMTLCRRLIQMATPSIGFSP